MLTNLALTLKLQQKTMQMFIAAPFVMASRVWIISATPLNSSTQNKELQRMVTEKQNAFFTSLIDVSVQILSSQMNLTNQWLQSYQDLMWGNYKSLTKFDTSVDKEALKIIDKGITPYTETVKSNAKRLLS